MGCRDVAPSGNPVTGCTDAGAREADQVAEDESHASTPIVKDQCARGELVSDGHSLSALKQSGNWPTERTPSRISAAQRAETGVDAPPAT